HRAERSGGEIMEPIRDGNGNRGQRRSPALGSRRRATHALAAALGACLVGLSFAAASPGLLRSGAVQAAAAGRWTPAGSMHTSRDDSALCVLRDGQVLVAGGAGGGVALASAAMYNPATALWSPTPSMGEARSAASATLLDDGRVLVAGGVADGSRVLSSAELY